MGQQAKAGIHDQRVHPILSKRIQLDLQVVTNIHLHQPFKEEDLGCRLWVWIQLKTLHKEEYLEHFILVPIDKGEYSEQVIYLLH